MYALRKIPRISAVIFYSTFLESAKIETYYVKVRRCKKIICVENASKNC